MIITIVLFKKFQKKLPWFIESAMYRTNTTIDLFVGNKLSQKLDFHIAVYKYVNNP